MRRKSEMKQERTTTKNMIPEILHKVSKETSFNKRVKILQEFETDGLKHIIKGAMDPSIQWMLPDTRPPFEVNEAIDYNFVGNSLVRETRKFSYFCTVNGQPTRSAAGLRQAKREQIFIQMLESLYKDEAELVISMVNKELPYPNMTKKLFNTAFPGILPESKKKEQEE